MDISQIQDNDTQSFESEPLATQPDTIPTIVSTPNNNDPLPNLRPHKHLKNKEIIAPLVFPIQANAPVTLSEEYFVIRKVVQTTRYYIVD